MSDKFNIEIITPDQTILKAEVNEVTIPSFEGQMGILKDHVPLITFLRPGIILVKNHKEDKFFVEEGTVEFAKNNLLILTSTVKNLKNLEKEAINQLIEKAENVLKGEGLSDKEKYIASYKIDTLKEINQ
jgi:F-type H+-transporting ATPase subunit epsilon/F-type H+-transporting ATPase subunit delta|tara:strand:+ start:336 stop:725 length:390 start_codon:yes stop_codon:yes gene_type:complete